MNYTLVYGHLATIIPAFMLGTYLMFSRKGSNPHRLIGKLYLALMFVSAAISLWMPAFVGPRWLGHFGFIHLFSILTILSVPVAIIGVRIGNLKVHIGSMIGLYIGGLIVAGGFALTPGRLIHTWFLS